MAGKDTGGTFVAIIGFIIILDSFLTIQNNFTGATATFVNGFELLLGILVVGVGLWQRGALKQIGIK